MEPGAPLAHPCPRAGGKESASLLARAFCGRHMRIGPDAMPRSIPPLQTVVVLPLGVGEVGVAAAATGNVCHASRLVEFRPRMSWLDELIPWRTKVETILKIVFEIGWKAMPSSSYSSFGVLPVA